MQKNKVLITGGAGFLGTCLVRYLLQKKDLEIVVFDNLEAKSTFSKNNRAIYITGDILSRQEVQQVFENYGPFATVYHLASKMPNKEFSDEITWKTNVLGTHNMISEAVKHGAKSFIFTSSNVTYGVPTRLPVTEETPPHPLEIYGKSKLQAEEELEKYRKNTNIQIFRCPVISGIGRLGLQSILFEFISENKNVYLLGNGSNKYQFVDALDLCTALEKASHIKGFDIYVIGGDGVMTLRELYQNVINSARSTSKIVSLPKTPALIMLSILDKLNLSPLGVYQYSMIGLSMYADTTKIKNKLGWKPGKTNLDSFIENYQWYLAHKKEFVEVGSGKMSANRSLPKLKLFKLLKYIS